MLVIWGAAPYNVKVGPKALPLHTVGGAPPPRQGAPPLTGGRASRPYSTTDGRGQGPLPKGLWAAGP